MSARAALRRFAARVRARLADSAWTPLLLKIGLGAGLFMALALVGSGAAHGLLSPAAHIEPAGSHARADPTASPAASSSASPEPRADAGVADASIRESTTPTAAVTSDGKVILNLATEEDLRRLPSIGPTRAHAIVLLRTRLGKLKRPEDLLRVKGIGRKLLGRLRPLVLVDPPAP
jgi:competence protein ComEA